MQQPKILSFLNSVTKRLLSENNFLAVKNQNKTVAPYSFYVRAS